MTSGATIQKLGLVNVNITGSHGVGGVVGTANNSTISQVYSTGTVNGSGNSVGGLIGLAEDACNITNFSWGNREQIWRSNWFYKWIFNNFKMLRIWSSGKSNSSRGLSRKR